MHSQPLIVIFNLKGPVCECRCIVLNCVVLLSIIPVSLMLDGINVRRVIIILSVFLRNFLKLLMNAISEP